jgi:hypothetical protein
MAAYVVAAVACGVCAAVGLALLVLVTQACNRATVQPCNPATLQPQLCDGGCCAGCWGLQPYVLEAATLVLRGWHFPRSFLTHSLAGSLASARTHLHLQASSGLASEEMAEMVSANHDALAASQQHVLELEHNMTVMIEQQAHLLPLPAEY